MCTTDLWDALKSVILNILKFQVAPYPIIVSLDTLRRCFYLRFKGFARGILKSLTCLCLQFLKKKKFAKGSSVIFEIFLNPYSRRKGGGGLGQIRIRKSLISIPKYVHKL